MTTIVTRVTAQPDGTQPQSTPLSSAQIDQNFINLNVNKLEVTAPTPLNTPSTVVSRDSSGNFAAQSITVVSLTETSSYKVKENINPIANGLSSVLQLTGVTYDRKDKSATNEAGLIAEEVNKILPNIVSKNADGEPEGINYTKLTAYLIEAVKDLQDQINELKQQPAAPAVAAPAKVEEDKKGKKKWLF